jgi:catechol 1,2-dioxygenase
MDEDNSRVVSRRSLILTGGATICSALLGEIALPASAGPTEPSGGLGDYAVHVGRAEPAAAADRTRLEAMVIPPPDSHANYKPTEDNILGPYFRQGAPYRAKVTPPMAPGKPLLVFGRVYSNKSRKALSGATIDIWQASAAGRCDNDNPDSPVSPGVFLNRVRLITDETGYYEFESVRPGRYQIGANMWRPSHIHYFVRHPQHRELVTQLYFDGDPYDSVDQFIKKSLIVKFQKRLFGSQTAEVGRFDIVLSART